MRQEFDKRADQPAERQADQSERQGWLGLLARAPLDVLEHWAHQDTTSGLPPHTWLRRPETGLAMVRARAGGSGEKFNLGEMTVTRCALRLASGETGIAYVQGRSSRKAELAAIADCLLQSPEQRDAVERDLIAPLRRLMDQARQKKHAQAQATRVDFFTLVRGEN